MVLRCFGSIFPEKLWFEENEVRTNRVNEVISLISANTKAFEGIKKGKKRRNFDVSLTAARKGIEPNLKFGITLLGNLLASL